MINKSNEFTRRILNFPAVRPCESVSFSSLLNSLINLGHTICSFKSRPFFTNKKNAKNSIRLIESLVVFLEEIPNGILKIDDSMFLSLSELHFIFQKIHFLLEDCIKDDARLLMLMKCEMVSAQFHILVRATVVAMDVFPIVISDEVQELLDFVKKQALKQKFEVGKDDNRVLRRVLKILDQFERGIAPESIDLERILDHLGIGSWCECQREVKFLESEIGEECLSAQKRDIGFFSSLMAFMIYCRCTVCENANTSLKGNISPQSGEGGSMIMGLNPDDFKCPITLEIMTDPVTISTGHTYDRSSILQWFRSGNHTCPKTGERLICIDLVPNHALKQVIKKYCHENGYSFPESGGRNHDRLSDGVSSLAVKQSMKLLAIFLVRQLVAGTNDEKFKAAYEMRLFTKTSVFNRSCLVEANAISPLLNLVRSELPEAQENAMATLMNLSKYPKSKKIIVENDGLNLIVHVLNRGLKIEARQQAAGSLFYLASIEQYRREIGRTPRALRGLIELIRVGSNRGKKNALVAILGLLLDPENHWRVLSSGLVPLIIDILKFSEREELVTDSLAVLATLAEKLDGAMIIVSCGTLPLIIEVFCSMDSQVGKEYCVSLLLALCINDGADVVPILVRNSSLMVALYTLLTDATSRSSKKARALIRILHTFNEKSSSGFMASDVPQERFVHVW